MIRCMSFVELTLAVAWFIGAIFVFGWIVDLTAVITHLLGFAPNSLDGLVGYSMLGAFAFATYRASKRFMFMKKLGVVICATFGNRVAEGQVNKWLVEQRVLSDWRYYQGVRGCGRQVGPIMEFAENEYGLPLGSLNAPDGDLSKDQEKKLISTFATLLIRSGKATIMTAEPPHHTVGGGEQAYEAAPRRDHGHIKAEAARLQYDQRKADERHEARVRELGHRLASARQQEMWSKDNQFALAHVRANIARIEAELIGARR